MVHFATPLAFADALKKPFLLNGSRVPIRASRASSNHYPVLKFRMTDTPWANFALMAEALVPQIASALAKVPGIDISEATPPVRVLAALERLPNAGENGTPDHVKLNDDGQSEWFVEAPLLAPLLSDPTALSQALGLVLPARVELAGELVALCHYYHKRMVCKYCRYAAGHLPIDCPTQACRACGQLGHIAKFCPQGGTGANRQQPERQQSRGRSQVGRAVPVGMRNAPPHLQAAWQQQGARAPGGQQRGSRPTRIDLPPKEVGAPPAPPSARPSGKTIGSKGYFAALASGEGAAVGEEGWAAGDGDGASLPSPTFRDQDATSAPAGHASGGSHASSPSPVPTVVDGEDAAPAVPNPSPAAPTDPAALPPSSAEPSTQSTDASGAVDPFAHLPFGDALGAILGTAHPDSIASPKNARRRELLREAAAGRGAPAFATASRRGRTKQHQSAPHLDPTKKGKERDLEDEEMEELEEGEVREYKGGATFRLDGATGSLDDNSPTQ